MIYESLKNRKVICIFQKRRDQYCSKKSDNSNFTLGVPTADRTVSVIGLGNSPGLLSCKLFKVRANLAVCSPVLVLNAHPEIRSHGPRLRCRQLKTVKRRPGLEKHVIFVSKLETSTSSNALFL